eukprot:gb/GECG01012781.1/.p1 GENE.gb/GECG01012781.1/~~gb/GECG01012781.1/.p1  ORF type:complete len:1316 (+),score=258.16 gb/GECG01012781.1/:1-3948(+)
MAEDDEAAAIMYMSHPEAAAMARKHRSGGHLVEQRIDSNHAGQKEARYTSWSNASRGSSSEQSFGRKPSGSSVKSTPLAVAGHSSSKIGNVEHSKPQSRGVYSAPYSGNASLETHGAHLYESSKFMPSTHREVDSVEASKRDYKRNRAHVQRVKAQANQIRKEARSCGEGSEVRSWNNSRLRSRESETPSMPRRTPVSVESEQQTGGTNLPDHSDIGHTNTDTDTADEGYDDVNIHGTQTSSGLGQYSTDSVPRVSSDMPEDLKEEAAKELVKKLRKDAQKRKKRAEKVAKADARAIQMEMEELDKMREEKRKREEEEKLAKRRERQEKAQARRKEVKQRLEQVANSKSPPRHKNNPERSPIRTRDAKAESQDTEAFGLMVSGVSSVQVRKEQSKRGYVPSLAAKKERLSNLRNAFDPIDENKKTRSRLPSIDPPNSSRQSNKKPPQGKGRGGSADPRIGSTLGDVALPSLTNSQGKGSQRGDKHSSWQEEANALLGEVASSSPQNQESVEHIYSNSNEASNRRKTEQRNTVLSGKSGISGTKKQHFGRRCTETIQETTATKDEHTFQENNSSPLESATITRNAKNEHSPIRFTEESATDKESNVDESIGPLSPPAVVRTPVFDHTEQDEGNIGGWNAGGFDSHDLSFDQHFPDHYENSVNESQAEHSTSVSPRVATLNTSSPGQNGHHSEEPVDASNPSARKAKETACATKIQCFYKDAISHRRESLETRQASKIQACFRGFKVRKKREELNSTDAEYANAIKIQKLARGYLSRKRLWDGSSGVGSSAAESTLHEAATQFQEPASGYQVEDRSKDTSDHNSSHNKTQTPVAETTTEADESYRRQLDAGERSSGEEAGATLIQKVIRGYLVRCKPPSEQRRNEEHASLEKTGDFTQYKGEVQDDEGLNGTTPTTASSAAEANLKSKAVKIQAIFRGHKERKKIQEENKKARDAEISRNIEYLEVLSGRRRKLSGAPVVQPEIKPFSGAGHTLSDPQKQTTTQHIGKANSLEETRRKRAEAFAKKFGQANKTTIDTHAIMGRDVREAAQSEYFADRRRQFYQEKYGTRVQDGSEQGDSDEREQIRPSHTAPTQDRFSPIEYEVQGTLSSEDTGHIRPEEVKDRIDAHLVNQYSSQTDNSKPRTCPDANSPDHSKHGAHSSNEKFNGSFGEGLHTVTPPSSDTATASTTQEHGRVDGSNAEGSTVPSEQSASMMSKETIHDVDTGNNGVTHSSFYQYSDHMASTLGKRQEYVHKQHESDSLDSSNAAGDFVFCDTTNIDSPTRLRTSMEEDSLGNTWNATQASSKNASLNYSQDSLQ